MLHTRRFRREYFISDVCVGNLAYTCFFRSLILYFVLQRIFICPEAKHKIRTSFLFKISYSFYAPFSLNLLTLLFLNFRSADLYSSLIVSLYWCFESLNSFLLYHLIFIYTLRINNWIELCGRIPRWCIIFSWCIQNDLICLYL